MSFWSPICLVSRKVTSLGEPSQSAQCAESAGKAWTRHGGSKRPWEPLFHQMQSLTIRVGEKACLQTALGIWTLARANELESVLRLCLLNIKLEDSRAWEDTEQKAPLVNFPCFLDLHQGIRSQAPYTLYFSVSLRWPQFCSFWISHAFQLTWEEFCWQAITCRRSRAKSNPVTINKHKSLPRLCPFPSNVTWEPPTHSQP